MEAGAEESQGSVYRSEATLGADKSDALVLMCSDRRFRAAAAEFLTDRLQLKNYDLLAVPGGVYMLSFVDALPKNLKVGMRMLTFIVRNHVPPQAVLIGHENCARYREGFASWLRRPGFSLEQQQRRDLNATAAELRSSLGPQTVQAYFARAVDGGHVEFEVA